MVDYLKEKIANLQKEVDEERARGVDDLELCWILGEIEATKRQLCEMEYNSPESVAERKDEARRKKMEKEKEILAKERKTHEKEDQELNILVDCLNSIGMSDLAERLTILRYAFTKPRGDYVTTEIDLRTREEELRIGRITTEREYKEIRKRVVRLSRKATKVAKKYKDLYGLYISSWDIVYDMKKKGIIKVDGTICYNMLEKYFTEPTGNYFCNGKYQKMKNIGYDCLEFYRDYDSDYREGVRKGKI